MHILEIEWECSWIMLHQYIIWEISAHQFFQNFQGVHTYINAAAKRRRRWRGDIGYSAVTRVVQRFEQKIRKDKELKKRIESIRANLSNVKGWYIFCVFPWHTGLFPIISPKKGSSYHFIEIKASFLKKLWAPVELAQAWRKNLLSALRKCCSLKR